MSLNPALIEDRNCADPNLRPDDFFPCSCEPDTAERLQRTERWS